MQITMKKSKNIDFDGEAIYYHNNISINDWRASSKVDLTQKLTEYLAWLYINAGKKKVAPEERVFIQNTALTFSSDNNGNLNYHVSKRAIQKTLNEHLVELGVIKHSVFVDSEGNKHIWKNGTKEEWNKNFAGLSKRYLILDIKRVKELFTITHKSSEFKAAKGKSRLRRFVYRRPFSLKEYVNQINQIQKQDRNDKVNQIREAKSTNWDAYLALQLKKFETFKTDNHVLSDTSTISSEITNLLQRFINRDPYPEESI